MAAPTPDRRQGERRESLVSVVEEAAEIAAQRIAAIHRRRLVVQCFLAALVVSATVSIVVILIANHQRVKANVANSTFNCNQWNEGATVLRDFVESDAKLRRDQQNLGDRVEIISGYNKLFGAKLVRELLAASKKLDRDAQDYWMHDLVPRLDELAQVNCDAVITNGGPDHQVAAAAP